MASEKEINEFRKDILELSFQVLDSQFKNNQKLLEIQRDLMETALDLYDSKQDELKEFAMDSFSQAKDNWEKTFANMTPQVPTIEMLIKQAKVFEDFITSKEKNNGT
jgi:hypothetical protein